MVNVVLKTQNHEQWNENHSNAINPSKWNKQTNQIWYLNEYYSFSLFLIANCATHSSVPLLQMEYCLLIYLLHFFFSIVHHWYYAVIYSVSVCFVWTFGKNFHVEKLIYASIKLNLDGSYNKNRKVKDSKSRRWKQKTLN